MTPNSMNGMDATCYRIKDERMMRGNIKVGLMGNRKVVTKTSA
jgi:hypothetical protein